MSKGLKFIFWALVVIIGALSTTSGFFYAKSNTLEKEKELLAKSTVTTTTTQVAKVTPTETKTTTTEKTEAVIPSTDTDETTIVKDTTVTETLTKPAPIDSRPSRAADTYAIATGDTLYSIGKKFDLSWSSLAEANGITDINMIKVGQVLMIPKNNTLSFTVTTTKAQGLQESANSGKIAFRLSPVETAKSDISPAYGILNTDTFKEKSKDLTAGIASVTVTHKDLSYEIKLTQPVTKGAKGIWAIESVKSIVK